MARSPCAGASSRGFTLVEALIVVAILGVLAAVALPNYARYRLRSKRSEAITNIAGIRAAQESFYGAHDNYANITNSTPQWGVRDVKVPWPNRLCSPACRANNTGACREFACIGFHPSGGVYYNYRSPHVLGSTPYQGEYCIEAQADLDDDGLRAHFELQSDNYGDGDGSPANCFFTNAS
ncbi:MAG: prepilin-type N-terminal cleavage/methylation domain-containing protein, partial [Myxococcota bacterium]